MAEHALQGGPACLAWEGWRMNVPAEWRPLRIEYEYGVGKMVLANTASPVVLVQWRTVKDNFDFPGWVAKRAYTRKNTCYLRGSGKGFAGLEVTGPHSDAEQCTRGTWFGYAASSRMLMELVVNPAVEKGIFSRVEKMVIPSISATDPLGPTLWSIFGVSFESPAGYVLKNRHMFLGDIAFKFLAPGARKLVLRQVYPAELALSRRKEDAWLADTPFKEYSRKEVMGDAEPFEVRSPGRILTGIIQNGIKVLPFPLATFAPLHACRALVYDRILGRILIAKHESPVGHDRDVVENTLARMNSALPLQEAAA